MIIPKKIKIGGHIYDVKHVDNPQDPNGHCGYCKTVENEILINKRDIAKSQQEETFIHEIVEAINYNYQLELPHKTISILGSTIYQVFNDNNLLR